MAAYILPFLVSFNFEMQSQDAFDEIEIFSYPTNWGAISSTCIGVEIFTISGNPVIFPFI